MTKNQKIGISAILLVFGWLYFLQPYATGYFFSRDPIWKDMREGYGRDGGEWSFGYFVPLAVLAILWLMRKEFLLLPVKPATGWGAAILLLGFFFYFAGYKANVTYVGYVSGQLLVMGTILWFLGWAWFRKGFWLWCLFGMIWPLVFLIQPISFPLRKVMVVLTAAFLNLVGVNAVQDGTAILTDTLDPVTGDPINLNIAAACSGLRSLFALVMIGLVFATVMLKKEWQRWALMACIPLVAVAGNFVRMLMLYYGSRFGGSEFAIGRGEGNESSYHIGSGLVVFVVALILITALVELMNRGPKMLRRRKVVTRVVGQEEPLSSEEAS